jgi:hypothetical protein
MQLYWGIPPFTTSSWRAIETSQRKRGAEVAGCAEAYCIPPAIGANRAGASVALDRSMIGASASAAREMGAAHARHRRHCAFSAARSIWQQPSSWQQSWMRGRQQHGCSGSRSLWELTGAPLSGGGDGGSRSSPRPPSGKLHVRPSYRQSMRTSCRLHSLSASPAVRPSA